MKIACKWHVNGMKMAQNWHETGTKWHETGMKMSKLTDSCM